MLLKRNAVTVVVNVSLALAVTVPEKLMTTPAAAPRSPPHTTLGAKVVSSHVHPDDAATEPELYATWLGKSISTTAQSFGGVPTKNPHSPPGSVLVATFPALPTVTV